MAANESVFDPADEVQQVDEHLIRQLRRRLLGSQIALWFAPPAVVPMAIVGITMILHVEPLSLLWYAFMVALVGAIAYCGYLRALLACKRRGEDPAQHRGRMVGSAFTFAVIHCAILIAAGFALFVAIVSHMGC